MAEKIMPPSREGMGTAGEMHPSAETDARETTEREMETKSEADAKEQAHPGIEATLRGDPMRAVKMLEAQHEVSEIGGHKMDKGTH